MKWKWNDDFTTLSDSYTCSLNILYRSAARVGDRSVSRTGFGEPMPVLETISLWWRASWPRRI